MGKFAVCSIAYNEADIIGACINNWKGMVDKHVVLVSTLPWNGYPSEDDGTARIAQKMGATVIIRPWKNEEEQRNFGLAYLHDYDYVLMVDPDELYLKSDQEKILKRLQDPFDYINRVHVPHNSFTPKEVITYWKSLDYAFSPPDKHKPYIAIDPKRSKITDKRSLVNFRGEMEFNSVIDVTMHHLSWVKTDEKVKEKISHYSHSEDIPPDWYEEVWLPWKEESRMGVRPYGIEDSIAVHNPAPKEIRDLFESTLL